MDWPGGCKSGLQTEQGKGSSCEAKMNHVCHSKGIAISGVRHHKMPVLPELQPWFEWDSNVPLLHARNRKDETDFDAYYLQLWQRKIQNFMFQVYLINPFLHLVLIFAVLGPDRELLHAACHTIQWEGIYSHLPVQWHICYCIRHLWLSWWVGWKEERQHMACIIFHRACTMHPLLLLRDN